MAVPSSDERRRFPIFDIAEARWDEHKSDCSVFVRAVALAAGVPLAGLANHLVDVWNDDPRWVKLGHDAMRASAMAERGFLVVAGLKEAGHGHVVVVPGRGTHREAMGYWGGSAGWGSRTRV